MGTAPECHTTAARYAYTPPPMRKRKRLATKLGGARRKRAQLDRLIFAELPFSGHQPISPGDTLADELIARAMSQKALARLMGASERVVSGIMNGEPLVARTALQLEMALGIPAETWLNIEHRYQVRRVLLARKRQRRRG